jgi:putative intracellular protease/amidase
MRLRWRDLWSGLGLGVVMALVASPLLLLPGQAAAPLPAAAPIAADEQAATIAAMAPSRPGRPVIAIVARNAGTEVGDLLLTSGVLRRADVAEVVIVAERAEPIQLYPAHLSVEPDSTMGEFDAEYPGGADYVVVPAMDPGTDPVVAAWIVAQHGKGAKVVSVCNGSRMMGTAGLLEGRRATAHWSAVAELQGKHPTMQWVPDRRYVSDRGVTTSTGITASVPTMLALVEAIAGRGVAARVAGELGLDRWDARHRSAAFTLTGEHKKTFVRNTLSFWRHQRLGIPVMPEVDEVALGLTIDAYSRTQMVDVVTVGATGEPVFSRYGLILHPDHSLATADVDEMLAAPPLRSPGALLDKELPKIAARCDRATAALVALTMEYPWTNDTSTVASR